jgi:hypothetical protein
MASDGWAATRAWPYDSGELGGPRASATCMVARPPRTGLVPAAAPGLLNRRVKGQVPATSAAAAPAYNKAMGLAPGPGWPGLAGAGTCSRACAVHLDVGHGVEWHMMVK